MREKDKANRALMIAVIVGLAVFIYLLVGMLPARSATCTEATIDWQDGPAWHPQVDGDGVYTAIVGTYLLVYRGETAPADDDATPGVLSVELYGDEVGATVCPDGTIIFLRADAGFAPGSDYEPVQPRVEDLDVLYPPRVFGSMTFQPW